MVAVVSIFGLYFPLLFFLLLIFFFTSYTKIHKIHEKFTRAPHHLHSKRNKFLQFDFFSILLFFKILLFFYLWVFQFLGIFSLDLSVSNVFCKINVLSIFSETRKKNFFFLSLRVDTFCCVLYALRLMKRLLLTL